jgi:DNA end-binding protein Ku
MKQIEKKIASGETHAITPVSADEAEPRRGAEVIDLVSLLRKSLDKKGKGGGEAANEDAKEQPKRAAARAKRKPENTINDEPTISKARAPWSADMAVSTRGAGTSS